MNEEDKIDLNYWKDSRQTLQLINVVSISIAMISLIYRLPTWFIILFVIISGITTSIRIMFTLMWINNKLTEIKERFKQFRKKRGEQRDTRRKERKEKEKA